MENFYITVAGPIGVGKTTVAELLGEELNCRILYETVENHPHLNSFYDSMAEFEAMPKKILSKIETELTISKCLYYSALTQIHFLFDRFWKHLAARASGSSIGDRSIYEDEIFARLLVEEGKMEKIFFFETYLPHFTILTGLLRPPDTMIILQASTDVLMERIDKRSRGMEQKIPKNYIKKLNSAYNKWEGSYSTRHKTITIETDTLTPKEIIQLIISKL